MRLDLRGAYGRYVEKCGLCTFSLGEVQSTAASKFTYVGRLPFVYRVNITPPLANILHYVHLMC